MVRRLQVIHRGNLKSVLTEMKELGFTEFNLGPEPEFFLFKLDENMQPTMELNDNGGYFDFAPMDLGENCRRDIVLELEDMGFEVEASHHECAPANTKSTLNMRMYLPHVTTSKRLSSLSKRSRANMACTRPSCQNPFSESADQVCIAIFPFSKMAKMLS